MIATANAEVGSALPELKIQAKNLSHRTDRNFEQNIHDDSTAQKLGFKRGFVAGGQTMAWISKMLVNYFGESIFTTGKLQATYVAPVFEDDDVVIGGVVKERVPEDGGVRLVCDIWLEKADGAKAIAGTASAVVK
jgi:hypothetical protein